MAAESLREQLLALPGVAEAEVEGEDGAPSGVKVRLAPEADAAAVGAEVQRVLGERGMRSRLGGEEPASTLPSRLVPTPPEGAGGKPTGRSLQSVVVEESAAGLQVTVVGSDGRRAARTAEASEAGVVSAAVAAVGMLLEGAEPRVLSVEWAEVEGSHVVTVVLEGSGGRRGAGAALVRASRGYAAARAAWSAIGD